MPFKSKALPFPFVPYHLKVAVFTDFIMSLPCLEGWVLGFRCILEVMGLSNVSRFP